MLLVVQFMYWDFAVNGLYGVNLSHLLDRFFVSLFAAYTNLQLRIGLLPRVVVSSGNWHDSGHHHPAF